jgi:hypothetical protein
MPTNPEKPVDKPYFHSSVEEHLDDLADQAKNPREPREDNGERGVPMQQVVFDSKHIDLFNEALRAPKHEHRRAAQRAMRGFVRAVEKPTEKPQGISINAAAEEFNVPSNFFWRWSKQRRVIPIVSEGTGRGSATILNREKAREVAELYHQAKREGRQPKKLLEERFPTSPTFFQK